MVSADNNVDLPLPEPPEERSHSGCGACGSGRAAERCGDGTENATPSAAVRFGYMRYIGEFAHPPELRFTCGAKVIVQTRRGIELGEQVLQTCAGCDRSVTRDQVKAWVDACGEDAYVFGAGRLLREATAADLAEHAHIQGSCGEKRSFAQQVAARYKLPLRVVECECPFGGERIIFYFTAAERVDFREMVKDLAKEYRTRIEMRQIGARDEARLLADFETCGREVCCKAFLKALKPINMRMAKLQKATLDPSQVSGRCGRLKCCLRYEQVGYEELDKRLPQVGTRIRTPDGDGVITSRQIITQLIQLRTSDDKLVTVAAEDIISEGDTQAETPEDRPTTQPVRERRAPGEASGRPREAQRRRRSEPGHVRTEKEKPATGTGPGSPEVTGKKDGQSPEDLHRRRRRRGRRRRRPRREGGNGETSGNSPPPSGG